MSEDYYKILGVDKSISAKDLKKEYKKLAIKYHPDKQHGKTDEERKASEVKFKEINNAYDILSDEGKRKEYDTYGSVGGNNQGFGGSSPFDIFSQFTGRGHGSQQRPTASNIRLQISINYYEAFKGCEKEIIYRANRSCKVCSGKGHGLNGKIETCTRCGGHGQVTAQQGFFTLRQTCPSCSGQGKTMSNPCGTCHGEKVSTENVKLRVKIPKGFQDGKILNVSNMGNHDPHSGKKTNVQIIIRYFEDDFYKFRGPHMMCSVPIGLKTAIYGGKVKVPTIHGEANITIPKGTNNGDVLKLSGKGFYNSTRDNSCGDLYVTVSLQLPKVEDGDNGESFDESKFTYESLDEFSAKSKEVLNRLK